MAEEPTTARVTPDIVPPAAGLRSHWCGTLRPEQIGTEVQLCGWAHRRRDHGGVIFLDLRDRTGLVQLVVDPQHLPQAHEVRSEYFLRVTGTVAPRPAGTENPSLPTGAIEVKASALEVLNACAPLPFPVADQHGEVDEFLRLRHRYLDLRRDRMQHNLRLRHRLAQGVREYLNARGFWEVETPLLIQSTPEGARDFLVPSRLYPGKFFALPQSPQILKQLLMVSGVERYYQLARCLRDEDLRADRQLEHTQIDLEMSCVTEDDVIALVEGLMQHLFALAGIAVHPPFRRLTYADSMERYGSDKPDLRYGLEFVDFTDAFRATEFRAFGSAVAAGGVVKGLRVPQGAALARTQLERLEQRAKQLGAGGLAQVAIHGGAIKSVIAKFLSERETAALRTISGAQDGDLLLLLADQRRKANTILGEVRREVAALLGLVSGGDSSIVTAVQGPWEFCWMTGFPLFEWNEDEQRLDAGHNPFVAPREDQIERLDADPRQVIGRQYDLTLNGLELGSGGIRNHRRGVQERVFRHLGMSDDLMRERFGFHLDALEYGAPPHGGIALGFDRIVAMLAGEGAIREVIAFPKSAAGLDPLTGAPARVDPKQLQELGLEIKANAEKGESA